MVIQKDFFIQQDGKKQKITANILDFPNFVQPNEYSCGVATSLSVLYYYGIKDEREWHLEKILKTTPEEWTYVENIVKYFSYHGFKTESRKMTVKDIESYISKSIPVIVLLQARSDTKVDYTKTREEWHYIVAIWYNKDYLFFDDPILKNIWYMDKKEFVSRRHDMTNKITKYVHHGIAIYGKEPKYSPLRIKKIK